MCGGHIHYDNNASVATCEFCGTEQTIVKTDDTKKVNLFNRANALRLQNEFDKAQTTYENILIDDPNNSEAHWGICLCRYGIEYVTEGNRKVPTCHRTVYRFIFDDIDYLDAINNADVIAKRQYEKEAMEIDKIQKNILSISQKEKPFDIFICYKESDEKGNRTPDSVMAQSIYEELTRKGYKVFFSKITLESKLGSEYEPIIFAALMSSKVMLAIASKPEYYNAPWVKNEWGRFLSFMKESQKKYLIPCFFDMDAYELPEDFSMLQAQDLGKIGYMQDLIRGIDKLFGNKSKIFERQDQTFTQADLETRIKNLLSRVKICIEDEEAEKASQLIEEILNLKSDVAEAYYYRLLIDNLSINDEDLIKNGEPFDDNKNYKRVLMYADDKLKNHLIELNEEIKKNKELREIEDKYTKACQLHKKGLYIQALVAFRGIEDYGNSKQLIDDCYAKSYALATSKMSNKKYDEAIDIFKDILDYNDSVELLKKCEYAKQEDCYYEITKKLDSVIKNASSMHYLSDSDEKEFMGNLEKIKELTLVQDIEEKHNLYLEKIKNLKQDIIDYKKKIKEKDRKFIIACSIGFVILCILITASIFIVYFLKTKVFVKTKTTSAPRTTIIGENGLILSEDGKVLIGTTNKDAKEIIIPNTIDEIERGALRECNAVEKIVLPFVGQRRYTRSDTRTEHLSYIFGTIPMTLKDVTITDSEIVQGYAFAGCDGLTTITFTRNVSYIGEHAFRHCSGLSSIDLGDRVEEIGELAFFCCTSLKTVVFSNSVKKIGNDAFFNCTIRNLCYDGTIEDWCKISFDNLNANPMKWSDYLLLSDENGSIEYMNKKYTIVQDKTLIIPNTISILGDYQFAGFDWIESVVIPQSIIIINEDPFFKEGNNCKIYYYGSKARWESIIIKKNEGNWVDSHIIYYYSDLEPIVSDGERYWYFDEDNNIIEWT
jgi:tetratricopeptide (TPR) repeat protein